MPVVLDTAPRRRRVRAKLNAFRVRSDSADLAFGDYEPGHDAVWLWHDVVGWFSTPDLDTAFTPVGTTGLHVAGASFPETARQVTILGTCIAASTAEALAARERLAAAWGDPDREFGLIVEEPGAPKRMGVRLAGPIEMEWARPTRTFTFEIPLVAPDPAKYALTSTAASTPPVVGGAYTLSFPVTDWPVRWAGTGHNAGVVRAHNAGTREAWPSLRVLGPAAPGWRITNLTTGESFGLDTRIGPRQELHIDPRRGRATLSGRRISARMAGTWWSLVPGTNRVQFTVPGYQAEHHPTRLTLVHASTWR